MTADELNELAVKVKDGSGDSLQLWKATKSFAMKIALRWLRSFGDSNGVEVGDLENVAFIAMMDAVEHFDPQRGAFLTVLGYAMKKECSIVFGIRTERDRQDPLRTSMSLDAEIADGDFTLADTVIDPDDKIAKVEHGLWLEQLRPCIKKVLDSLTPLQREIIIGGVVLRKSNEQIADELGLTVRRVRTLRQEAYTKMRSHKNMELLEEFSPTSGTGLSAYINNDFTSVSERYVQFCERNTPNYWKDVKK